MKSEELVLVLVGCVGWAGGFVHLVVAPKLRVLGAKPAPEKCSFVPGPKATGVKSEPQAQTQAQAQAEATTSAPVPAVGAGSVQREGLETGA